MLVKQIQPVQILDKTANRLVCNLAQYQLGSDLCILDWALVKTEIREVEHQNPEGEDPIIKEEEVNYSIYMDHWQVPVEVINQWGNDDEVLIIALANVKGFIIVE